MTQRGHPVHEGPQGLRSMQVKLHDSQEEVGSQGHRLSMKCCLCHNNPEMGNPKLGKWEVLEDPAHCLQCGPRPHKSQTAARALAITSLLQIAKGAYKGVKEQGFF